MNDEQRLAQELRDFYLDDASPLRDRDALLRGVLDTVHTTPQRRRRRWWPFGRHAALTTPVPSRELQPTVTTATANGQAADSGHASARLGGIAVALVAVVLAFFGGFAFYGLLQSDEQGALPGASGSPAPATSTPPTEAPSDAPSEGPTDATTATTPATPAANEARVIEATTPSAGLAEAEPGFDSVFVEPGVERIVSDGAGFDLAAVPEDVRWAFEDIAIRGDDIWVVGYRYHADTGRTEGPLAWELGSGLETGPAQGFPREFQKLLIEDDGTAIVVADDGVRAFDGERWVDAPGSRLITGGEATTWVIEPGDLANQGEGLVDGSTTAGAVALRNDGAGYAMGDELGYRYVKEWPTAWFSCGDQPVDHGEGNGCNDRGTADQRGLGASHNDGSTALLLADTVTGRLDRHDDSSIWVLVGPSIDDFFTGRADESGAIYRIDATAPGFLCQGCY